MNIIYNNIYKILVLNGSVMVIPGINFLLVARYSLVNGLNKGLCCAAGITAAIMIHVFSAILSISLILKHYPSLFLTIRYGGAGYLIYLGTKFLISGLKTKNLSISFSSLENTKLDAFRSGFLTDLLNPFVGIFYLSLFSTVLSIDRSVIETSIYSFTIFTITLVWFSLIAFLFARPKVQTYFENKKGFIQILSGIAMYYFSFKVIFNF